MKKGYWVVAYRTVGDEATMKNYLTLAIAGLGQFGARTLVSPMSGYGSRGWAAADGGRGGVR
jgi:hypothetical protein